MGIALTLLSIFLGESIAASQVGPPYNFATTRTGKLEDPLTGASSAIAASADSSSGVMNVSGTSESRAPAGFVLEVPSVAKPAAFGSSHGYASASILHPFPVSTAGEYEVDFGVTDITSSFTTDRGGPLAFNIYASQAIAYANLAGYVYCYSAGYEVAARGTPQVSVRGQTSAILTASINCPGPGYIEVSLTLYGVSQADGTARASFSASAKLSSITLRP